MASDETIPAARAEQKLLGRALRALRERAELTQSEAGDRLGITSQAWQKYEGGERKFTRDNTDRLMKALGASPEELAVERARILGHDPVSVRRELREREPEAWRIPVWGRVRAGPSGPDVYDAGEPESMVELASLVGGSVGALRIAGDSMVPWGEPGELVIFDRNRYPRRGQGCVVETTDGYFVKLYEKNDGSTLFVRELYPEERTLNFALREVKGVYAIRMRGD